MMSPRPVSRPLVLAAVLLAGCPPVYAPGDSASGSASSTTTSGGPTGTTEPEPTGGDTSIGTTTVGPGTTTTSTTDEPSTGPATTTGTTGDSSTTDDSTTGVMDPGKMGEWGHACAGDDECAAILGDKGVCLTDILMLYELPGGYCTKECTLPDEMTMYDNDNPTCGPEATCIGAKGYFEACAVECTDDSDCPREGYECRVMPAIGMPGDPKFCLMTDEYML